MIVPTRQACKCSLLRHRRILVLDNELLQDQYCEILFRLLHPMFIVELDGVTVKFWVESKIQVSFGVFCHQDWYCFQQSASDLVSIKETRRNFSVTLKAFPGHKMIYLLFGWGVEKNSGRPTQS